MIKTTLQKDLKTTSTWKDKQAIGSAFGEKREQVNPAEMLACSLGACMMTMVGYMAAKRNENAEGTFVEIGLCFDDKHSRITEIALTFTFPASFTQEQKAFYARVAQGCPVHNSLREDIIYTTEIK